MSARATFAAWGHIAKHKLTPCAKLVLLGLANRHNQETGRCDPSLACLSKDLGVSERAIRYGLRELEGEKIIATIERRLHTGRGRRNLTNRYKIKGVGAGFAGGVGHKLPTNLTDSAPSAYDDLAMILDDVEDAATAGFAEKKGRVK